MNMLTVLASLSLFHSCVEPFEIEGVIEDFENALVVEATITNEMKQHQVFLTRTFDFDKNIPSAESNANVSVIAEGTSFTFEETAPGVYVSSQSFAALPNTSYQLQITTQEGKTYSSNEVFLTPSTRLDGVRAERITNDVGEDGIAILVDSFDATGQSVNYRYTYQETYRIIAPDWRPFDLIPEEPFNPNDCDMVKVPRENEEQVCYATVFSNSIIQTNTNDLLEDRVSNFMVRFINRNNFIISHRYSILVRQFVQSNSAFRFYETLAQLSGNESLFSGIQPGFLQGNVFSEQDEEEKVLGLFDVASVTESRIFFNYTDFYPNEPLPPYFNACIRSAPPIKDMTCGCVLRPIIENGFAVLFDDKSPSIIDPAQDNGGPFVIVPRVCGDCTALGEIEVPEFWTE